MSVSQIFDSPDIDPSRANSIRPLWTLGADINKPKKVLAWLTNTYLVEKQRQERYREEVAKHYQLYDGKHYATSPSRAGYAESSSQGLGYRSPKVSKLVLNYLAQGTQLRANLTLRNRPSVNINPVNSEYTDRVAAKLTNYWTQYQLYQTDFEKAVRELVFAAYAGGEAYLHPFWDPERGQPMPAWTEAEKLAGEDQEPVMPVTDENGDPVLGEDGEPLVIQKPVRTGDIAIRVLTPLNTLVQSGVPFDRAAYFIEETWQDIDEVKAKYPDVEHEIVPEKDVDALEFTAGPQQQDPNQILVLNFWHKSTDFLGRGRFISATRTTILENKPLPKGMTSLPLIRLADVETPSSHRGHSLIAQAKGANGMTNDLASMIRRNAVMTAHPKWLIPAGSKVKREAIGNDITQVDYAGPTAPQLIAPPPVSQEVSNLRREFRDEIYTIFRVSENQQGKTMPNVRSALAQQQIDEADEQRANTDISKYHAAIRKTVECMLEIAACYYEKGDPRLIPIVGKDKRYLLRSFDPTNLQRGFDVRVTNSTGMPQSKSAKVEALVALRKEFGPMVVRDEAVIDMIEFGESERYFDQAAVASRSAEAENEAFMSGEGVADPVAFEDLVVHWTIHLKQMQNRGFKTDTPLEVQAAMVKHVIATEFLMLEAARRNPQYAVQLTALPQFPIFYTPDTVDMLVLDRARTGVPLSLMELKFVQETGQLPPTPVAAPPQGKPGSSVTPSASTEEASSIVPADSEDAGPEMSPATK